MDEHHLGLHWREGCPIRGVPTRTVSAVLVQPHGAYSHRCIGYLNRQIEWLQSSNLSLCLISPNQGAHPLGDLVNNVVHVADVAVQGAQGGGDRRAPALQGRTAHVCAHWNKPEQKTAVPDKAAQRNGSLQRCLLRSRSLSDTGGSWKRSAPKRPHPSEYRTWELPHMTAGIAASSCCCVTAPAGSSRKPCLCSWLATWRLESSCTSAIACPPPPLLLPVEPSGVPTYASTSRTGWSVAASASAAACTCASAFALREPNTLPPRVPPWLLLLLLLRSVLPPPLPGRRSLLALPLLPALLLGSAPSGLTSATASRPEASLHSRTVPRSTAVGRRSKA